MREKEEEKGREVERKKESEGGREGGRETKREREPADCAGRHRRGGRRGRGYT
jgi:hypothetical protein